MSTKAVKCGYLLLVVLAAVASESQPLDDATLRARRGGEQVGAATDAADAGTLGITVEKTIWTCTIPCEGRGPTAITGCGTTMTAVLNNAGLRACERVSAACDPVLGAPQCQNSGNPCTAALDGDPVKTEVTCIVKCVDGDTCVSVEYINLCSPSGNTISELNRAARGLVTCPSGQPASPDPIPLSRWCTGTGQACQAPAP